MKARIPSIAIPMAVGFIVTLALMWHQIGGHLPLPNLSRGMTAIKQAAFAEAHSVNPAAVQAVVTKGSRVAAEAEPDIEIPSSDSNGPPMPLLFAVSSHPAMVQGDDGQSPHRVVTRQIDLSNQSGQLLDVVILVEDPATRETSHAQLLVPPHQQAHAGAESGLALTPGGQVTLRSKGYQEMTATVN